MWWLGLRHGEHHQLATGRAPAIATRDESMVEPKRSGKTIYAFTSVGPMIADDCKAAASDVQLFPAVHVWKTQAAAVAASITGGS